MMTKTRMNYIDELRGFAIFLVVLGHAYRTNFEYSYVPFFESLDASIYLFHMPLFFFVSGLTFYSKGNLSEKYKKYFFRSTSLLVPTFIWMAIQLAFNLSIDEQLSLFFYKYFSALMRPFQQFWFMYALVIILGIVTLLFSEKKSINLLLTLLLFLYVLCNGEIGFVNTIAWGLMFFYLGICFKGWELKELSIIILLLSFFILLQQLLFGYVDKLLASSLIVILLFTVFKFKKFKVKVLEKLGLASVVIYFTHIIIRDLAYILFPLDIYIFSILVTFLGLVLPLYIQKSFPKILFKFELKRKK